MTVQYLTNTCDVDGWEYGEQTVAIYKGEPLFGHDYSDSAEFDITDSRIAQKEIQQKLGTREEIEFEQLEPEQVSKALLKKLKKFFNV